MDEKSSASADTDEPIICYRRCAVKGYEPATKAFCRATSGTLEHAKGACLLSSCRSPERLCVACVEQKDSAPGKVQEGHDRLCMFHIRHGMRAVRGGALRPVSVYDPTLDPAFKMRLKSEGFVANNAFKPPTFQRQTARTETTPVYEARVEQLFEELFGAGTPADEETPFDRPWED